MVDLRACNGFYQIFITVNFQNIIEASLDSDTFKNTHVMSGQYSSRIPEKYKKVLIDGVAPLCLLDVSLVYWQGFRSTITDVCLLLSLVIIRRTYSFWS